MGGDVRITLLGGFEIDVDGTRVDDASFERRHGALLVKLLALTPGRRLHREQVIDALWPDAMIDEAAPRLHKAATFARNALGDKGAITIRDEIVALWPERTLTIDAEQFEQAADLAQSGSVSRAEAAADVYGGDLLPADAYEDWVIDARDRLRLRHIDVLRTAGRYERILEIDPADEGAHLDLMRRFMADGQRLATLRQFERMERALREELGVSPSPEAMVLRSEVLREPAHVSDLVGRAEEQELMRRTLDDAAAGSGAFILISGVPGIGKSALADWFVQLARERGWATGRAVAASVEGPWPYAPVLEAIDDMLRGHPDLLDALPATHRDELQRVRHAPSSAHEHPDDGEGHQRLFVAVDEVMRRAARAHGLVLLVDDVHAADHASLTLLHYVARRAVRERLVLVATARSGTDADVLVTIRELVGRHGARELKLAPFGIEHTAELIRSVVDDTVTSEQVDRIRELSGGTPFYVRELAESVRAHPLGRLPDHLTAIVAAGLADLSPALRRAMARAAVVGDRFDTDEFVALSGLDEEQAFDLLDEALAREVVEPTSGGYEFRHGLLREALLGELAPHRRRTVHRDAAHRLEQLGTPPARVAHHLIEAGELKEAAPWALRAAKAAQAVGALRDALSLVDSVADRADPTVRVDLLALRADLLAGMGEPGAVTAFRQALAETVGPTRRLLEAKMARAAMMGGDIATAQAVLGRLEPDGGPFDGAVLHAKGMLAYFTGDLDVAEAAAEQARPFALGDGAPASMLDVLTLQGMVAHNKGVWFDRMRTELTLTADSNELAATVFDCHL
jgi:DNA-binding SARP family transcriptional activator